MSVCVSPLVQVTTLMNDESLSCPQCPKSFSSTKLLQQHQQMFHTDKAFICETCGKAFRFRSNLAEHRSVHTALKPYVCKYCGKSSRLKGNLTKHILKHHKKEQNEAIAKDDIIVKKAPKVENGTTTNGTSSPSSVSATAVISSSTGTNGTHHNNNNNSSAVNNNHRPIKMEIEDPEYISMSVTKSLPVAAKVVATSSNSTPRSRPKENNNTVVTTVTTPAIVVPSLSDECALPKDATTDTESFRAILISLGLDFGNSLPLAKEQIVQAVSDLKHESSGSPESVDSENSDEFEQTSPPTANFSTIGGEATLALIVAATNASLQRGDQSPESTDSQKEASPDRELSPESDPSTSSSESCPSPPKVLNCKDCGKILRRKSHVPIHMTMSHGYPPPAGANFDAEEEDEEDKGSLHKNGLNVEKELRRIASAISELREAQSNTPKIEDIKALITIDSRVGKLEKSLETALNSIYTLVQLQSGMTSSVNRLRQDSAKHFAELKSQLHMVYTPQRISRRNSVRSESVSRERSRSPL